MAQLMNASCAVLKLNCYLFSIPICSIEGTSFTSNYFSKCYYSGKHPTFSPLQIKRYCNILGVPINASEAKIKQSFYKKSMIYHPDKNKGAESGRRFNEISEAYQALMNYKRYIEESRVDPASSPWGKFRHRPVRSFHHAKPPTYSHKSTEGQQTGFDADHSEEHSSNTNLQHSNASDWCNQFYMNQLKKDFKARKDAKIREKLKAEKDDNCIVM